MNKLEDIPHAVGTVSWFTAAVQFLQTRLEAAEAKIEALLKPPDPAKK